jgi:hypothetical protein
LSLIDLQFLKFYFLLNILLGQKRVLQVNPAQVIFVLVDIVDEVKRLILFSQGELFPLDLDRVAIIVVSLTHLLFVLLVFLKHRH